MKDLLDYLSNNILSVSLFSFIGIVLKVCIDELNIRGVEKVLLTNYKKLRIHLSLLLSISLFYGVIVILSYIAYTGSFNFSNLSNYLLVSFIGAFIIILPVYFITLMIAYLISFKCRYFLYLGKENKKSKWYISRAINKKILLVDESNKNYKFLNQEDLMSITICEENQEKKEWITKKYEWVVKNFPYICGCLLLSIGILVYLIDVNPFSITLTILFLIILLAIITVIYIYIAMKTYEKQIQKSET